MGVEKTTWVAYGIIGTMDNAPEKVRELADDGDGLDEAGTDLLQNQNGLDRVEVALAGDMYFGENELYALYARDTVVNPDDGTYAELADPTREDLEQVAMAASILGLDPARAGMFVSVDVQ